MPCPRHILQLWLDGTMKERDERVSACHQLAKTGEQLMNSVPWSSFLGLLQCATCPRPHPKSYGLCVRQARSPALQDTCCWWERSWGFPVLICWRAIGCVFFYVTWLCHAITEQASSFLENFADLQKALERSPYLVNPKPCHSFSEL